jgi:hypothetical protein
MHWMLHAVIQIAALPYNGVSAGVLHELHDWEECVLHCACARTRRSGTFVISAESRVHCWPPEPDWCVTACRRLLCAHEYPPMLGVFSAVGPGAELEPGQGTQGSYRRPGAWAGGAGKLGQQLLLPGSILSGCHVVVITLNTHASGWGTSMQCTEHHL